MKRLLSVLFVLTVLGAVLTGCGTKNTGTEVPGNQGQADKTKENQADNQGTEQEIELPKIVVGASTTPHAEILEKARPALLEAGYDLKIVEYVDYVQPNLALDAGDLDANYFQHQPYLDQFNEERGTDLVSTAIIHYEPFGIYPGKTATIEALADGAQIAVPNDATNEARALLLLEAQGLITLNEGVGLNATKKDIKDNPKKLDIVEIEAAQLARSLQDVDLAVINGNYAIEAGLNVGTDSIAVEDKDSVAAETFGNIIAVKRGDESREDIKALVEALQNDIVRQFINDTYEGAVIPKF